MPESKQKAIDSLISLKTQIKQYLPSSSLFIDDFGHRTPPIKSDEIVELIESLISSINSIDSSKIQYKEIEDNLASIPVKVEKLIAYTLPQISEPQSIHSLLYFIYWLFLSLNPILTFISLKDQNSLPKSLNRRISSLSKRIDDLEPEYDQLAIKIKSINDAYNAAEELPESLETLKNAKDKASSFSEQISKSAGIADVSIENIKNIESNIKDYDEKSRKILSQCENALRASTSVGLAASFEDRAKYLNVSIRWWVAALSLSLLGGAVIAFLRIDYMNELLSKDKLNFTAIIVHLILSSLCIGGPLWFAWISTNQISYRFKLSEDYSFKSSIAKAYEGYRREAVEIDESFIHRLFGSTLDRLEQEPMRVMEQAVHSSPYQEFLESQAYKDVLSKIPDLEKIHSKFFKSKNIDKEKTTTKNDSSADAAETT